METQSVLLFILAWLTACFLVFLAFAFDSLDSKIRRGYAKVEDTLPDSSGDIEKVWHRESWVGNDSFRVISLAHLSADRYKVGYQKPLHLTTSYYSQVKFLVKRGCVPTAIVFLVKSRWYGMQALVERSSEFALTGGIYRKAIDLEQIGAPDFLLSKIPLIGRIFRARATLYLLAADSEISQVLQMVEMLGSENIPNPNSRIEKGLIWGKLYSLTRNQKYKERVLGIRFKTEDRETNRKQYERIAKLVGFRNSEELFASHIKDIPPIRQ